MQSNRPAIAIDPRVFGRRRAAPALLDGVSDQSRLSDDLKLFGSTFAAGFLFVFLIIA